jgi:hypothetical protein
VDGTSSESSQMADFVTFPRNNYMFSGGHLVSYLKDRLLRTDNSHLAHLEIENAWSFTFTHLIPLYDMVFTHRDEFIF